jgi:hypothetical protein
VEIRDRVVGPRLGRSCVSTRGFTSPEVGVSYGRSASTSACVGKRCVIGELAPRASAAATPLSERFARPRHHRSKKRFIGGIAAEPGLHGLPPRARNSAPRATNPPAWRRAPRRRRERSVQRASSDFLHDRQHVEEHRAARAPISRDRHHCEIE